MADAPLPSAAIFAAAAAASSAASSHSIGSGALTIKKAIVIAAIFEFAGAVLAGGEVTSTIRKGMVDSSLFADTPELLIYGMLASLLAAGTWLFVASQRAFLFFSDWFCNAESGRIFSGFASKIQN